MELSYEVIDLPTRHEFRIAREGARLRRDVWVRLRAPDGVEGWGEAAATPYYGETGETVMGALPRLREALAAAGDDPFALERAERRVELALGRSAAARSAVSAALHDLVGKRLGVPVWKLWGLDPVAAVSSFTIGIDEPEAFRAKLRGASDYPILKIKVGTGRD